MKEVSDFYDQFSTIQYKSGVHKRHLLIIEWLKYFGLKKNHNVLEIGSGIGTVTGLIAEYVNQGTVVANDISEKSIEIARGRLKKFSNLTFSVGDVTQSRFDQRFDAIVLPDVLEHIPMELHADLLGYLHTILSDDGFIAIHIPDPFYLESVRRLRPEELQVIDQSLHISFLAENFQNSGFYISYLKGYAIWNDKPDYQIIKLKKQGFLNNFNTLPTESQSLLSRVLKKVKRTFGLKIYKLPI